MKALQKSWSPEETTSGDNSNAGGHCTTLFCSTARKHCWHPILFFSLTSFVDIPLYMDKMKGRLCRRVGLLRKLHLVTTAMLMAIAQCCFAALRREALLASNKADVMWEPDVVGMNTDEDGKSL